MNYLKYLIIGAFSISNFSTEAQTTAQPKDKSIGYQSSLITSDSKNGLHSLVYKINSQLNEANDVRIKAYSTTYSMNISLPNYGILISTSVLNQIATSHLPDVTRLITEFLVAHEFGHQLQYLRNVIDLSNNNSCELRTLFEAQADILAGYFVSNMEKWNDTLKLKSDGSDYSQFNEYIYDLGNTEFAYGTHPSHMQRRNAIRLGIIFNMLGGNMDNRKKQKLKQSIGYEENDSLFAWSMMMAKRIVHYPNSVIENISITSSDVQFDTSSSHPIVVFHRVFKNIGNKPIRLFLQFELLGKILGYGPEDKDERQTPLQGESHIYEYVLNPQDTILCDGTLNWASVRKGKYRPVMIFPPDNDALYNAEYLDSTNVLTDDLCPGMSNYQSNTPSLNPLDLALALTQANNLSRNNFEAIEVGFADQTYSDEDIGYQSKLQIPTATNVKVLKHLVDSPATLDIDFYSGYERLKADSIWEYIRQTLINLENNNQLTIRRDYSKELNRTYDEPDSVYLGKKYAIENENVIVKQDIKYKYLTKSVSANFHSPPIV
jgi:hypothetical protein